MELNRDDIIKALEYCTGIKSVDACANCPVCLRCNDCVDFLREESLALIKEITEENEYLRQQNEIYATLNKKLEDICESYAWQYGTAISKELFLKKERADTVRKMQEKLNDTKFRMCGGGECYIYAENVDVIAKEMLEESNV